MSEKLKEYQVIDVFCGGTFYKVRHKVTNNIFAWKAYSCRDYSDEQIQNVVNEVKIISEVSPESLLRYYDTILHGPTKTLYFVLEFHSWRSLQELLEECKVDDKHFAESFVWHLLHELARVCKSVADINVVILRKCISTTSIFVGENGELRVNCFELMPTKNTTDLMRQAGDVIRMLCYPSSDKLHEFHYSDDLKDIIGFITEDRSTPLRPDVILYHPTVLTHLETHSGLNKLRDIFVTFEYLQSTYEVNKCDSEKVVDLCRSVQPLPRTIFNVGDSPIYSNISSKRTIISDTRDVNSSHECLSPTLAALALELPGYVPRSRKPYAEAAQPYTRPQLVSQQTLSQEWMSRLELLKQREESLNKREKDLLIKEIINSPSTGTISLNESTDVVCEGNSDGITLPPLPAPERREWARRRPRRASARRQRRQSCGYAELDSSLSADAGDGSMLVTARKITNDNMPRRTIFPELSNKKVHFTSVNPFAESDESVTLTFYELDGADKEGYEVPRNDSSQRDITKFKYLDTDKVTKEKRSPPNWSHSSPTKQAKITMNVFNDISNHSSIRRTPSKSSLSSRLSLSRAAEGGGCERARASIRHTLAQTPVAPDMKKKSRKSLIPFKTPFKFMSSNRY